MPLQPGQAVNAETLRHTLRVEEKLGEGGQGEVYRVSDGNKSYALKWYTLEQATQEQKQAILYLVKHGPPAGATGQRFIWPLDLVTLPKLSQFGYLMSLIDTQRFAGLGEVQAHRKPSPSLATLCEISYQTANSYRALHLKGYCYRDISADNLMFDPLTGDVLICDNDNIGINRQSACQVWGTMEYMAPEVVRGRANPSTETDLHSLAVLLFNLWVWHHPLHGLLEYQIHVWDLPAKRRIYGELPLFIFDPKDKRNELPNDPAYYIAKQRWGYCPSSLQTLFIRAFTNGLQQPARRVTEGEWQGLFIQLKDGAISCPKCLAENLWYPGLATLKCWHCATIITVPPKLVFKHANGPHSLLLTHKAKLLQRHIKPNTETPNVVLGEMVRNPNSPDMWGIRNLTEIVWLATFSDGTTKSIGPQRAVSLTVGLKLKIGEVKAEIVG